MRRLRGVAHLARVEAHPARKCHHSHPRNGWRGATWTRSARSATAPGRLVRTDAGPPDLAGIRPEIRARAEMAFDGLVADD